jgi:hypothetical protein
MAVIASRLEAAASDRWSAGVFVELKSPARPEVYDLMSRSFRSGWPWVCGVRVAGTLGGV